MTTFFSSDLHFGHKRIVELSRRPFSSVAEMEETVIKNWNARVTPQDQVFLLGDFSFGPKNFQTEMLARLQGRITLVRGNHDGSRKRMLGLGFADVVDEAEYAAGFEEPWYLAHKPWWQMRNGAISPRRQLCGHVHNDWVRLHSADGEYDVINVGVDVWDFTPRTFVELIHAEPREVPLLKAMDIPHHGDL